MKVAGYSDVMVEFLAGFFVFISCFISAICSRSVASVVRRSSLACEREEEWPDLEWISVGEVGLVKGLDFAFFILYLCYERHWRSLVRCHGDMPPPSLAPSSVSNNKEYNSEYKPNKMIAFGLQACN